MGSNANEESTSTYDDAAWRGSHEFDLPARETMQNIREVGSYMLGLAVENGLLKTAKALLVNAASDLFLHRSKM